MEPRRRGEWHQPRTRGVRAECKRNTSDHLPSIWQAPGFAPGVPTLAAGYSDWTNSASTREPASGTNGERGQVPPRRWSPRSLRLRLLATLPRGVSRKLRLDHYHPAQRRQAAPALPPNCLKACYRPSPGVRETVGNSTGNSPRPDSRDLEGLLTEALRSPIGASRYCLKSLANVGA